MNELLDECYENHISVVERKLEDFNGAFINYKSTNIIALNSNLDSCEKNCVLCEELGHFYKCATYNINCEDKNYIRKMEYKAKKYAIQRLVPIDRLINLSRSYNRYEVAQILNVTDEFLEMAVHFYRGEL